ncbi:3-hydroxyacyl-[acyl-carrier-protein] dehydratase [Eubacterium sp. CAG:786]|nr:3-hydroxyacyl-[acyl-carrier-protein] dehydratase [Eubacterium sp. CAG:786]
MMNLLEINERIKQRPPFQMIERVTELVPNESAKGIKCVSVNEPYFMGHFPGAPIMPGVLLIESAAQLCSLVIAPEGAAQDDNKMYVLLKVKDFKFLRPVIPGDRLEIEVKAVMISAAAAEFSAVISCDGTVRAKGSMLFTAMDKNAIYG